MSLLRLQLLGPPRAWRDDQLLRFKRRKTLALLAYLGVESGLHTRDALAALLWPETAGGDARSSLRTTLVDLRQVLGESALTWSRRWRSTAVRSWTGWTCPTPQSSRPGSMGSGHTGWG